MLPSFLEKLDPQIYRTRNYVVLDLWLAGFFEGEGSIFYGRKLAKRKRVTDKLYRAITVQVSQTNRIPLDWFKERFGGSVCEVNPKNATRRTWCWTLAGRPLVGKFSEVMSPLMPFKGEKLVEALERYDSEPASISV